MPIFRTTYNILTKPDAPDIFDENWMDSDKLVLPPKSNWDYNRELQIEDVDVWEVIYEGYKNTGLYAAWSPYAEFYLFLINDWFTGKKEIETFYGKGAQKRLMQRLKEFGIVLPMNKVWVDQEEMYLYE